MRACVIITTWHKTSVKELVVVWDPKHSQREKKKKSGIHEK